MNDLPRLQLQLLDPDGAPLVESSISLRPDEDVQPETRIVIGPGDRPRASDELAAMVERSLLAGLLEWHGVREDVDVRTP